MTKDLTFFEGMSWRKGVLLSLLIGWMLVVHGQAQHSIARKWNEVLLEAIRNDLARPTVHARNLFHLSAAMYDAWAVFEPGVAFYFLGQTVGGYTISYDGFPYAAADRESLRQEAISYAAYRLLAHRFRNSPDFLDTRFLMDSLQRSLGYEPFTGTDYASGSGAALGNYIAQVVINFGLQDGSNELGNYTNRYYAPVNDPLDLMEGGDNPLTDPNRWQPLQFGQTFIDQSGNPINLDVIDFLSPEWGEVVSFSLAEEDRTIFTRDEQDYFVYKDPGPPPYLDSVSSIGITDPFKWGFALVSIWSSHLDVTDGEVLDISPGAIGNMNIDDFPQSAAEYEAFYDLIEGGDPGEGYATNPATDAPYIEQMVPRADYARVLAEFWADGPDSETPPGHWFTILNYVMDHPAFSRRFQGVGEELDALEYDVKAYFTLGGAMHDAAIASWSVKGYYDYVRPISAIRHLATQGQSSDASLPRFHPAGIPLLEGYTELVTEGDPLVGSNGENLHEVKLFAWRGHDGIEDPEIDTAGVGWVLAKEWWPYQRPSFVTPPFAGYVSGHSTYSRAAAEVLTLLTGDEYFPGGMGEFVARQNEFLVFEEGPSVDVVLQWAKYYDASDQCSLSRIWGGIHPPADDIPGRLMGADIGKQAFVFATSYFDREVLDVPQSGHSSIIIYPNPATQWVNFRGINSGEVIRLLDIRGKELSRFVYNEGPLRIPGSIGSGLYFLQVREQTKPLFIARD